MKNIFFVILMLLVSTSNADTKIVQVSATDCKPGPEFQPNGPFAIYNFCDAALGTNIAIYLNELGVPLNGKYELRKRFWQGEEWGNDVTSWSWLPNDKLLLATSSIYGSGKLYILNLPKQEYKVLYYKQYAVLVIHKIEGNRVTVKYEIENEKAEIAVIEM
jgi:hypothetical protein